MARVKERDDEREDEDAGDAKIPVPLPLPQAIRRFAPAGADGRVAFSADGSVLMQSTYPGHSSAWHVESGELLLKAFGADVIGQMMSGQEPGEQDMGALLGGIMSGFDELLKGTGERMDSAMDSVGPKLTDEGKARLRGVRAPTGLHDVDVALKLVKASDGRGDEYSPDGRFWTRTGDEGRLSVVHAATGKRAAKLKDAQVEESAAKCFSPDAGLLAAEGPAGCVSVWETGNGRRLGHARAHRANLTAVAISPDNQYLATAGGDRVVLLWRLPELTPLRALTGWGQFGATVLQFTRGAGTTAGSTSGPLLLLCCDIDTGGLFEVPSLETVVRLGEAGPAQPSLGIGGAAVSPDGKILALSRGTGWVDLVRMDDLLANPSKVEPDQVKAGEPVLPTEADDAAAAEAAERMVRGYLDAVAATPVAKALASLGRVKLPSGARIGFEQGWWEGWALPVNWVALGRGDNELSDVELPELPDLEEIIPGDELNDPQYESAADPASAVANRVFRTWLAEQWAAHAPKGMRAVWMMHDGGEWEPL